MRYPHFAELGSLVEGGLVTRRKHPDFPIYIYNYGPKAMGEWATPAEWPQAGLDARGLVLNEQGQVIARGFRKFFNFEQVRDQIPWDRACYLSKKMDGSLLLVFNYGGQLVTATRGSFQSEQALRGREILERKYPDWFPAFEGFTWLFEVIYPENRIVVDYGNVEELYLLTITLLDGRETIAFSHPFPEPTSGLIHAGHDPLAFAAVYEEANEEGWVARWVESSWNPVGGFRCKIKYADYCRLHRLYFHTNTRSIWECVSNGLPVEIPEEAPTEFREWARNVANDLWRAYGVIEENARNQFALLKGLAEVSRKEFALRASKVTVYPHLQFALLDGKDIAPMIWKALRPERANFFRKGVVDE